VIIVSHIPAPQPAPAPPLGYSSNAQRPWLLHDYQPTAASSHQTTSLHEGDLRAAHLLQHAQRYSSILVPGSVASSTAPAPAVGTSPPLPHAELTAPAAALVTDQLDSNPALSQQQSPQVVGVGSIINSAESKRALRAVTEALASTSAGEREPPSGALRCTIMPHQRLALGWMCKREDGCIPVGDRFAVYGSSSATCFHFCFCFLIFYQFRLLYCCQQAHGA
jgi:hypothetical protein